MIDCNYFNIYFIKLLLYKLLKITFCFVNKHFTIFTVNFHYYYYKYK